MANNPEFDLLLSQLKELDKSKDILRIGRTLDRHFDSKIHNIITKWKLHDSISDNERLFMDLYSSLQLYFIQSYFFDSQSETNDETINELFISCLFRKNSIDDLIEAVSFIRGSDQSDNDDNDIEDDEILNCITRMLDARSFAYRLCAKELLHAKRLNDELKPCLIHQYAKNYIYDIISKENVNKTMPISNRHKFFIGCCTFAFASYDENEQISPNSDKRKYVCMLAKYVRVVLNKKGFERNQSMIYCLRGILALLTNRVPVQQWIHISNTALGNPNDEQAQQANPFNTNLFVSIIGQLLGSNFLRDKAIRSDLKDITSLVDVALIFLNKWCSTSQYVSDDDDDNNKKSAEPNRILDVLRSHKMLDGDLTTAQVIVGYINAKYDRLQLMTISTLSYVMNYQNFEDLKNIYHNMPQNILKLIFGFIDKTVAQENKQYKGISFELLLHYLLRFLAQDIVKEQMTPYISKIIHFSKERHLDALKILRKVCLSPKMAEELKKNYELEQFLTNKDSILFDTDPRMKKIIEEIKQSLFPKPEKENETLSDADQLQGFISYCHNETAECDLLHQKLNETRIFKKIWIDRDCMKNDMVLTITAAIRASKAVFAILSEGYCNSDYCRREWNFAQAKKIKIYPIIVHKKFSPKDYDWASFVIGTDFYYRINEKAGLEKLIKHLNDDINTKKVSTEKSVAVIKNSHKSMSVTTAHVHSETKRNCNEKPILEWESNDIEQWCREKNLKKWCEPLAFYHGPALLDLHKALTSNSTLLQGTFGQEITLTDVVLFKYELNKLIGENTEAHQLLKEKDTGKRHVLSQKLKK